MLKQSGFFNELFFSSKCISWNEQVDTDQSFSDPGFLNVFLLYVIEYKTIRIKIDL